MLCLHFHENFELMKYYIGLILMLFFAQLWGQQVRVTGILVDRSQLPIGYAAVTFEGLDSNAFQQVFSEGDGTFEVMVRPGKYDIIFQLPTGGLIEREENITQETHLGTIVLESAIKLSETVAIGEKPIYRLELDKRVYDMQRDPTVKGANLSDALNNVPSVQVDSDGSVSLRGNTGVRILIDGKPSAMTGISDVGAALQNIPAETVERVEVITNPSSRYDAEGGGGIINIILKKGSNQGFNANITTNVGYQPQAGISASINYKTNKWNWFINPSFRYDKNEADSKFRNYLFFDNGIDSLELTKRTRTRKNAGGGVNLGFEHYLSKKSTITLSGNYRNTPSSTKSETNYWDYANNVLFGESLRIDDEEEKDYSLEGNLGYKYEINNEGHELNIQSSVSHSQEDENSTITDRVTLGNIEDVLQKGYTYEKEDRVLLQVDYVYPIGEKSKFEAGYKSEWENEITDFSLSDWQNGAYIVNPLFADIVDFQQNIHALYSQYGRKFGRFSFLAGLRLENSDITIQSEKSGNIAREKNYTNLFPSATFNYAFDEEENNQLQLSYSRRIRRPWSRFLNPSYNFSDLRNTFVGNPDLDPTYSNNFELAYITSIGKTQITPSVYYNKTTNNLNIFRRTEVLEDLGRVFVTQPVNAGNQMRYGAELVISTQPARWWRLFGNLNVFGYDTDGVYISDSGQEFNFDGNGLSWFGRISNNFNLPSKINFQLNAGMRGAEENAQERRKARYSVDMALSKDILQDRGTLSLNVRDVFNSRRHRETNFGENFVSEVDMQWRPRTITLSFSYRINQQKKRERGERGDDYGSDEGMEM